MKLLPAQLTGFEKDKAVLVFADGQKLLVEKNFLPGFKVGETISLNFFNELESKEQRQKILKAILNEIIDQKPPSEEKPNDTK